jgi:hypothetical protein
MQKSHPTGRDVAMRPPKHTHGNGDSQLSWPDEFFQNQLLPAVNNRHEWNDRGFRSQGFERLSEPSPLATVAVPDGKEMMSD